jgi:hypothetical protein
VYRQATTMKRTLERLVRGLGVGLASVAACAGAAPAGERSQGPSPPADGFARGEARGWTPDADVPAAAEAEKGPIPADAGSDSGPRCPYGALEDPHRGFVRCLLPDERDAGWLPPPPQGEPPAPEPPRDAGPGAPLPIVEIGPPKFESGEVTKVEKSLNKAAVDLARCVAEHGGLTGESATVKVQFLVRSRGRAEGVEVLAAKGVSAEAAGCVRLVLKNKAIGAPTADPVGVTVTITFKSAK